MRQAYSRAGRGHPVFAGDIWLVADHHLTFGDIDPSTRTQHPWRYVLVMQGDDHADNAMCPTVLVAPLSSNTTNKRSREEILDVNESPLSRPSIVKIHLIQPIPRIALTSDGSLNGSIPDLVLDRFRAHLLMNLGIIQ